MSKHNVLPPCDVRPPHDDCYNPCFPAPCPPLDDCFPHHHHEHFHANCGETKYYKLPLWKANTTTSWMYGINKAMMQIDFLFHQFALRTAINGSTDELQALVEKLELEVECLRGDVSKNVTTLAELSKVIADTLAADEVRDEKLRRLNTELKNLSLRVSGLETQGSGSADEIALLKDAIDALTIRVTDLENPDNGGTGGDDTGTGGETGDTQVTGDDVGGNNGN